MNSFIKLYNITLNQLQGQFYGQNNEKYKFTQFCRDLLKRTIFLAFYLVNYSKKSPSGIGVSKYSRSSDILSIMNKFTDFNRIADIFFPLDLKIIGFLEKKEKHLINNILMDFIESFSWELNLDLTNTEKEKKITPEMFELIYYSEKASNRGVVFTPYCFAYLIVHSCFQRHLARFLKLSHFSLNDIELMEPSRIEMLKNYISQIRVLDISVGCGTFYLAAFNYLLTLNNQLGILGKKTFSISKKICLKNLYAIDIDENALVVCKIQLTLQILRESPSIHVDDLLEIISNINLKTGDSLMGFTTNPGIKGIHDKITYNKILFRDIKDCEVKNSTFINDKRIFHWFLEFPEIFDESEISGFDILIGNPPYIGYRFIKKTVKCVLRYLYPMIYTGLNDYYYYFIWRAKQLLAPDGSCALIVARYFLEARYAHKLRSQLFGSGHGYVDALIDFREFKIFPKGINSVILFLTNKTKSNQNCDVLVLKNHNISLRTLLQELQENLENLSLKPSQIFHQFTFPQGDPINGKFLLASRKLSSLIKKIESKSVRLSQICDIGTGYHSGKDTIFSPNIIEENGVFTASIKNRESVVQFSLEKEVIKEIVKTTNILPFMIVWNKKYVILTKRDINIDDYPLTKHYLEQFKEILMKRYEVKKNLAKWYEIAQIRNQYLFENKMKIICPYRARVPRFAIDKKKRYSSIDCTSIVPKKSNKLSIYYILGVLNSELIEFYLYAISKKLDAQKIELYPKTISNIPLKIPRTEEENFLMKKITELTKNICSLLESYKLTQEQHQVLLNNGKRGFFEIDRKKQGLREQLKTLDFLVYQLYGIETEVDILKSEIIQPYVRQIGGAENT
ncbi:MAG: Eco57I restriction-modification methylase domain-containing protein [Candidatus Hodarchaeales archaeon]